MLYLISIPDAALVFAFNILLSCVATVPAYFIIRFLKKRNRARNIKLTRKQVIQVIVAITVLMAAYLTYTAYFPTADFYKEVFRENTRIKFPADGKIRVKGSVFPETNGAYSCAAIFETDAQTIADLIARIGENSNFKKDTIAFRPGTAIKDKVAGFDPGKFELNYYWGRSDGYSYLFNVAFDTTSHLVAFDKADW